MGRPQPLTAWCGIGSVVALGLAWTPGCAARSPPGSSPEQRPIHERIDLPSIAACGGCHRQAYREWSETLHHRAWTNANVRAATRDFTRAGCRPCHSPLPVLPRGLDRRPGLRDFNEDDGVHCLSCHGLTGGVAAARTIAGAPCRPRFEPRLRSAEICFPCHEPTHRAFTEYRTSNAFVLGLRCADCHMPPRKDRPGHDHGPNGGLNRDFVARAVGWSCRLDKAALRVELRNRCGHKFPGEIPSRSFVVRVDFPGRDPVYEVLRKPHPGEVRADNRLLPDETRVLRFVLPPGAHSARLRLLFKPFPLLPDRRAFVLADWSSPQAPRGGRPRAPSRARAAASRRRRRG